MTINDCCEKHGISKYDLAMKLGISKNVIYKCSRGYKTLNIEAAKKLKEIGIEVGIYGQGKAKNKKQKEKEPEKIILFEPNEFQLSALKQFGNTIVSKKHGPKSVIASFEVYGFNVLVRNFDRSVEDDGSHYVVEVIK